MARIWIQIIVEGHFIQIFEYSCSSLAAAVNVEKPVDIDGNLERDGDGDGDIDVDAWVVIAGRCGASTGRSWTCWTRRGRTTAGISVGRGRGRTPAAGGTCLANRAFYHRVKSGLCKNICRFLTMMMVMMMMMIIVIMMMMMLRMTMILTMMMIMMRMMMMMPSLTFEN